MANGNGTITKNISISIGLVIILIGVATTFAYTDSKATSAAEDVAELKTEFQSLPQTFVPRNEIDARLQNIEKSLDEIKKAVTK